MITQDFVPMECIPKKTSAHANNVLMILVMMVDLIGIDKTHLVYRVAIIIIILMNQHKVYFVKKLVHHIAILLMIQMMAK